MVQIDHTPVDLIVVDEQYRRPIGRPYLTLAIDVYSRCIPGFCLSLEAPSAVSAGLCIAHAVLDKDAWLVQRGLDGPWPIWGKPDCIHLDNAAEFYSEALSRGCEQHGIGHRASTPWPASLWRRRRAGARDLDGTDPSTAGYDVFESE